MYVTTTIHNAVSSNGRNGPQASVRGSVVTDDVSDRTVVKQRY